MDLLDFCVQGRVCMEKSGSVFESLMTGVSLLAELGGSYSLVSTNIPLLAELKMIWIFGVVARGW